MEFTLFLDKNLFSVFYLTFYRPLFEFKLGISSFRKSDYFSFDFLCSFCCSDYSYLLSILSNGLSKKSYRHSLLCNRQHKLRGIGFNHRQLSRVGHVGPGQRIQAPDESQVIPDLVRQKSNRPSVKLCVI